MCIYVTPDRTDGNENEREAADSMVKEIKIKRKRLNIRPTPYIAYHRDHIRILIGKFRFLSSTTRQEKERTSAWADRTLCSSFEYEFVFSRFFLP